MNNLTGNMIIKNGIKFDYPFIESCLSILPICDEFVFVEGNGDDGTYEKLVELQKQYPKIKVYRHTWPECTSGGTVLADMTNIAIEKSNSKFYLNIQADEAINEENCKKIAGLCQRDDWDCVQFGIYHFFSNFETVYKPGVFYDTLFRLARRSLYPSYKSMGDAMALGETSDEVRKNLRIKLRPDIKMFHLGYCRFSKNLIMKQREVVKYWGYNGITDLDPFLENGDKTGTIKWSDKHGPEKLEKFTGYHSTVFLKWIEERKEMVSKGIVK